MILSNVKNTFIKDLFIENTRSDLVGGLKIAYCNTL